MRRQPSLPLYLADRRTADGQVVDGACILEAAVLSAGAAAASAALYNSDTLTGNPLLTLKVPAGASKRFDFSRLGGVTFDTDMYLDIGGAGASLELFLGKCNIVAQPPYLLSDTFTDTNGVHLHDHTPDVGPAWADLDAGITIQGNKASDNSVTACTVADVSDADVNITADLVLPALAGNGFFGIAFRAVDATHFLIVGADLTADETTVWENDGGAWNKLAGVAHAYSNGQAVAVSIVLSGTSIKATFGGVADIDIAEASFATATKHGLYSDCAGSATAGTWDNLVIQ
jgi:hypothetical protein